MSGRSILTSDHNCKRGRLRLAEDPRTAFGDRGFWFTYPFKDVLRAAPQITIGPCIGHLLVPTKAYCGKSSTQVNWIERAQWNSHVTQDR
jgi:hypothetical protein